MQTNNTGYVVCIDVFIVLIFFFSTMDMPNLLAHSRRLKEFHAKFTSYDCGSKLGQRGMLVLHYIQFYLCNQWNYAHPLIIFYATV